jgi:hypothetical protein
VLADLVARYRPIGHQLLYGIHHPDDYIDTPDRYTGGAGLSSGTYKRSYRWPQHVNVMSVAGVWDGGPLLGNPLLPVPKHQPLDGNPFTGNGTFLIPNEVLGPSTATIWSYIGKSDGVVPNLSVIEQVQYKNLLPGSPWHHQVNPADHYGIDMSGSWVLPSGGDAAGGGRIGSAPTNADNIPVTDRFRGSKITYVEVQAEHNGMLHNEHLMRAIKRRLGARSVTPNVDTPVITAINPSSGPLIGGNTITITGSEFKYIESIHFGSVQAFVYTVSSPNSITVQVPQGISAGYADVTISNTAGVSGQTAAETIAKRYTYLGTIARPMITPNGGDFTDPVDISITTETSGAEIYYTWTDSDPGPGNSASKLYTGPFKPPVNPFSEDSNFALRVKAYRAFHQPSETVSALFNAGASTNTPVIGVQHSSPPDGSATITMSVTSPPGASFPPHIYYTTNGTDPTFNSTPYQGPFNLGIGVHTIKARTIQLNYNQSAVATGNVTIYDPSTAIAAPVVSPMVTQAFSGPINVSMSTNTEDAVIRYTLAINGGVPHDPTETGPGAITYTEPFQMNIPNGHMYIKARAFKSGVAPSIVVQTGQLNHIVPVATAGTPTMKARIYNEPARVALPAGWSANNGGGNAIVGTGDGGYLLLDHEEDWIITEAFDLAGYSGVQLHVDLKRQSGSDSNRHLLIEISEDDGQTWNPETVISEQAALNWTTRGPYDLNASGSNVRLRFIRTDENGFPVSDGRGVGIRNFTLDVAMAPLPHKNVVNNPVQVFIESYTPNPQNPGQNLATTMMYTTDGSEPDNTLPLTLPTRLYQSGGVSVNGTGRIRAVAYNKELLADSDVTTAELVFKGHRPVITPPSGNYVESVTVEMTTKTGSSQIRYTLDGTEPNENSELYTGPFVLTSSLVNVIARTFKNGYVPGEITSAVYNLTEASAPEIQAQFIEKTLIAGDSLSLVTYVSGQPAPGLQWFFNGEVMDGASGNILHLDALSESDSGTYSLSATNSTGKDSLVVGLIIVEPAEIAPVIEEQPASLTLADGSFAGFSVTVRARPAPLYQWYKDGIPIRGATSEQLSYSTVTKDNSGGYSVVVTNPVGSDTSTVARLTVTPSSPPFVTRIPDNQTVQQGDIIQITIEATGDPEPQFVWHRNGTVIEASVESTLTIPDAKITDSGDYFAYALNFAGADTSDTFTIYVEPTSVSIDNSGNDLPEVYALHHNYPNPFNPSTSIPFDLPYPGVVEINIYNVLGQRVNRIYLGHTAPGRHIQLTDFNRLASGVYFYEIRVDNPSSPFRAIKKLMFLK